MIGIHARTVYPGRPLGLAPRGRLSREVPLLLPDKDMDATLDYVVDFRDVLEGEDPAQTISSASVTALPVMTGGIAVENVTTFGTCIRFELSGGTPGVQFLIGARAETSGGLTLVANAKVFIPINELGEELSPSQAALGTEVAARQAGDTANATAAGAALAAARAALQPGGEGDASDLSVVPAGQAGASARSFDEIEGDDVNVLSFNPPADGVTDATPKFTEAAEVAKALGKKNLFAPSGSYAGSADYATAAGSPGIGASSVILEGDAKIVPGTAPYSTVARRHWPTPTRFRGGVGPQHLKQLHAAAATGSATVIMVGDSIFSEGDNAVCSTEISFERVLASIQTDIPTARIYGFNRAIGGTTLNQLWYGFAVAPWWYWPPLPAITSISVSAPSAGFVTVTAETSSAHNRVPGDWINTTGSDVAAYNTGTGSGAQLQTGTGASTLVWKIQADSDPAIPNTMPTAIDTWLTSLRYQTTPDVIIFHFGSNDQYGFDAVALWNVIAYINTWAKVPDLIFGTAYQPSINSPVNNYNTINVQKGVTYAAGYIRTFAQKNGHGLLDYHRWGCMIRDGYDPCDMNLTQVIPVAGGAFPGFGENISTSGDWEFPVNANDNGTQASDCTDYGINWSMTTPNALMSFPLSFAPADALTPQQNLFLLDLTGEFIRYFWTDGFNGDNDDTTTSIPVPTGVNKWQFSLRGNILTIDVQLPANQFITDTTPPLGLGFTRVCQIVVSRFGASFQPRIGGIGSNTMQIFNFCIANAGIPTDNCTRFYPSHTNDEIYAASTAAGGSDAYHPNGYGARDLFTPVIEQSDWRPPVVPNSLNLSGQILVGGPVLAGGLGAFGYGSSNQVWLGAGAFSAPGSYIVTINGKSAFLNNPGTGGNGWQFLQYNADGTPTNTALGNGCVLNLDGSGNMYAGGYIQAVKAVTAWETAPPSSQPNLTGNATSETAALLFKVCQVLGEYGFAANNATPS